MVGPEQRCGRVQVYSSLKEAAPVVGLVKKAFGVLALISQVIEYRN